MAEKRVTIKVCTDSFEAAFLASYLEANGINVVNTYDNLASWTGRYGLLSHGARLRVWPEDAARARALLEHPPTAEQDGPDVSPEGPEAASAAEGAADHGAFTGADEPTACPNCGSTKLRKAAVYPGGRLLVLLLSAFFGEKRSVWVCEDCEWDSLQSSGDGPGV